METARRWLFAAALPAALTLALAACSDSPRPYGAKTTTPAATTPPTNTAAPAADASAPPPDTSAPVIPPATATDVDEKKGTETGMVGGASGTVASGGKPGSGTASGGGTGPAVSSGETTEEKK